MKLIFGLGNPGEKYLGTRHNLGFMVLDEYAKKHLGPDYVWEENEQSSSSSKKLKSLILKLDEEIRLVKPLTFMNNSGQAVSLVARYFKVKPDEVIVIHDDLDLQLGKIKVRAGGSAAGHHGVESIIEQLGSDSFIRVRLGIGNLRSHSGEHQRVSFSAEKFVVEGFMSQESSKLKRMLKQAVNALDLLLSEGLDKAQNQFN